MTERSTQDFQYDVCLSFAGENRSYVHDVAVHLRALGVRVFFDEYEEVGLWGKDLYEHLDDVYKNSARYCVMFISQYYSTKLWTTHERRSAQERAFKENAEYILPARFDGTPVPGLRDTVGYIDLASKSPHALASLISEKVGWKNRRRNFLPPVPDLLFKALEAEDVDEQSCIYDYAMNILFKLERMNEEERILLYWFFCHSCPGDLPENVHINIDFLRRLTGQSPSKIKRVVGRLESLGIFTTLRDDTETEGHIGRHEMLVLEWHDMRVNSPENVTDIACEMIRGATHGYCEEHGLEAVKRLDFSQLATVTTVEDKHGS
jgi:hypothetical protein